MGIIFRLSTRGHPLAPNGRAAGCVRTVTDVRARECRTPRGAGVGRGRRSEADGLGRGPFGVIGSGIGDQSQHKSTRPGGAGGSYGIARAWAGSRNHGGEFDPGSGSTLAACLMHASRTGRRSRRLRGGRVRNTWAIWPEVGGSPRKRGVIPHGSAG